MQDVTQHMKLHLTNTIKMLFFIYKKKRLLKVVRVKEKLNTLMHKKYIFYRSQPFLIKFQARNLIWTLQFVK